MEAIDGRSTNSSFAAHLSLIIAEGAFTFDVLKDVWTVQTSGHFYMQWGCFKFTDARKNLHLWGYDCGGRYIWMAPRRRILHLCPITRAKNDNKVGIYLEAGEMTRHSRFTASPMTLGMYNCAFCAKVAALSMLTASRLVSDDGPRASIWGMDCYLMSRFVTKGLCFGMGLCLENKIPFDSFIDSISFGEVMKVNIEKSRSFTN